MFAQKEMRSYFPKNLSSPLNYFGLNTPGQIKLSLCNFICFLLPYDSRQKENVYSQLLEISQHLTLQITGV